MPVDEGNREPRFRCGLFPAMARAIGVRASALTRADVVKAFNTTFSGTLVAGDVSGQQLDVFVAGDSVEATSSVLEFVTAAGMRPIPVGGLHHARELEGFMLLLVMGMQANPDLPEFNWNTGLKILS